MLNQLGREPETDRLGSFARQHDIIKPELCLQISHCRQRSGLLAPIGRS
jgi:hypothetical protein